jgi:hypothetical protein
MAAQLQGACARAGLHLYPGASLTVYDNSNSSSRGGGGGWGKGRKRGRWGDRSEDLGGDEGDGDAQQQQPAKSTSMYLTLPGKLDRRHFR